MGRSDDHHVVADERRRGDAVMQRADASPEAACEVDLPVLAEGGDPLPVLRVEREEPAHRLCR